MKLVTAQTMKSLDRYTIEDIGIPGIVLMEIAGRSCAEYIAELCEEGGHSKVVVLCGPGNNGGDGFVLARHLANWGYEVTVALHQPASKLKGDALLAYQAMKRFPVNLVDVGEEGFGSSMSEKCNFVLVDALFGTGLERPVQGHYAKTIEWANSLECPKVAVDIPTGVCSDTGRILGCAFRADLTVTFGAAKIGHYSYPGRAFCGRVELVDIGIPRSAIEEAPGALLLDPLTIANAFAQRPKDAFKNRFGHVLIVGGLTGKAGAALLAARAATRTGAGLVTVLTDREAQAHLEGRMPEVMVEGPLTLSPQGEIVFSENDILTLLQGKTAIAVGPGLSLRPGADRLLRLLFKSSIPMVCDADALTWMAQQEDLVPSDAVLTPHPGEASRLLRTSTSDIQENRIAAAQNLSEKTKSTVVLKGAGTIVADPSKKLAINPVGGPALATAGTGDVLTGVIAALLARNLDPFEAACAGVFVHGLAGDIAARDLGEHSVSAADVAERLADAIREISSE